MMEQINEQTRIINESETAWGLLLQPSGCPACGQAHLIPQALLQPGATGMICPNCARELLQPQPARLRSEPPEMVIPFQVHQGDLRDILSKFVEGVWLRFDDFDPDVLLERVKPLYLPMWLVDSSLDGTWRGEMGYSYQVKSSQEYYQGSEWQSRELVENRLRWEPRLGQIHLHYDNTITPAMSDYDQWTSRVGRFAPAAAQRFDLGLLKETLVRVPDLDTTEAWPQAEDAIKRRLSQDCLQAADAQQMRHFTADLSFDQINWTQLLLPVYFTWYSGENGQRYPVYINGQSGSIGGVRMASQRKGWKWAGITAAIGLGLFLLALACFALAVLLPPAGVAGSALAVVALLVVISAAIPAVWPWQWNSNQR